MRPLAALAGAALAAACAAAGTGDGLVRLDRAWPVMGTLFEASALAPDTAAAQAALAAAKAEVFRVDSLMSTYKPESEVSRLDARAGTGEWTELSPSTLEVLDAALAWSERTGGAFDPTVGPLVEAWGFRNGEPRVPPAHEIDSLAALVGWRAVELERARPPWEGYGRSRLPRPGMAIDLGAIAKGYALDRAIAAMQEAGAVGGMADLGGHVSVFGRPPDPGEGWPIGIRNPRRPEEVLGRIVVEGSASVATSGDYERFFEVDGTRYSHILDPRTGRPSQGIAQVTVAAPGGTAADALSTALFVAGPEEGRAMLERWAPWATAVWILDPGEAPVSAEEVIVADSAGVGSVEVFLESGAGN